MGFSWLKQIFVLLTSNIPKIIRRMNKDLWLPDCSNIFVFNLDSCSASHEMVVSAVNILHSLQVVYHLGLLLSGCGEIALYYRWIPDVLCDI